MPCSAARTASSADGGSTVAAAAPAADRPDGRLRPGRASAYFTVPAAERRRPLSGAGLDRARHRQRRCSWRRSLEDVDATLHRLLLIELLVTAAVLAAHRRARPLGRPARAAPARARSSDRRRDRRRRPVPACRARRAADRGGTARPRAERDARADRVRPSRPRTRPSAKLRRFVADASHELRTPLAARPRVRGALLRAAPTGTGRRPRALDDRHPPRVGADEPARRRPAPARAARRGPPARARAGRARTRSSPRRSRRRAPSSPTRPIDLAAEPASVLGDRDRLRQVVDNLLAQRPRAHAGRRAGPRARRARERHLRGASRSRTPARGWARRTPSASSSASTAPTPRAPRSSGGVGLGLVDRGRGRRSARRQHVRSLRAWAWLGLRGQAAAPFRALTVVSSRS